MIPVKAGRRRLQRRGGVASNGRVTASDVPMPPGDPSGLRRWFVYLIECCDGSIYTGIATDVGRRYALHAAGKGARYTRSRPPRRLLASFAFADRSSASRAEYAIKQLTPAQKRAVCADASLPAAIALQQI
jgi:putative endonuclease